MAEIDDQDVDDLSRRGTRKRKFSAEADLTLLRQVSATGAHTAKRGSQGVAFEAVATALNGSGTLSFKTDGKHCLDRYCLLMRAFASRIEKVLLRRE
jgi:hypothetical protein